MLYRIETQVNTFTCVLANTPFRQYPKHFQYWCWDCFVCHLKINTGHWWKCPCKVFCKVIKAGPRHMTVLHTNRDAFMCPSSQAVWLQQSKAGSWRGEDALPQRSQWVNEAQLRLNLFMFMCVHVCGQVRSEFTPPCTERVQTAVTSVRVYSSLLTHEHVCVCVCVCGQSSWRCLYLELFFKWHHYISAPWQPCWQRTHEARMIYRCWHLNIFGLIFSTVSICWHQRGQWRVHQLNRRQGILWHNTKPAHVIHCNIDSYRERKYFKMSVSQEASVLFWE